MITHTPLRKLSAIQETAYSPYGNTPTVLPPVSFDYGTFQPLIDIQHQALPPIASGPNEVMLMPHGKHDLGLQARSRNCFTKI